MQSLKIHKPSDDAVYLYILKKEQEVKPKKVAKIAGLILFYNGIYSPFISKFTF